MRELLDRRPGSDALLDRSGLELAFYDVLVNGGLPPPVLNHPVWIDGQKYVIDIAYPDYKVGAEVLSEERHVDLHHFHYDPARFNILQVRGGWTMLGFTSRRLTEPECVVAEMKAALGI